MTETMAISPLSASLGPHTASRGCQGDVTVGPKHNRYQHQNLLCVDDSSVAAGQHAMKIKERRLEELLRSLGACSSSSPPLMTIGVKANNSTINTNIDDTNACAEAVAAEISVFLPFVTPWNRRAEEEDKSERENKSNNNVSSPATTSSKDRSSTSTLYGARCEGFGAELCALFGMCARKNGTKTDTVFPFHSEEAIKLLAKLLLSINSYYELAAEVAFSSHIRGLLMYASRIARVEKGIVDLHRKMTEGCRKGTSTTAYDIVGEEREGIENKGIICLIPELIEQVTALLREAVVGCRLTRVSQVSYGVKPLKRTTSAAAAAGEEVVECNDDDDDADTERQRIAQIESAMKQVATLTDELAKLVNKINEEQQQHEKRKRRSNAAHKSQQDGPSKGQDAAPKTTQRTSSVRREVSGLADCASSSDACTDGGRTRGEADAHRDNQDGTACREVVSHTCAPHDGNFNDSNNYQQDDDDANVIEYNSYYYTNGCEKDDGDNNHNHNNSHIDAAITFITVPQSLTELRPEAMTAGPTQQGVPCSSCNYFYPLYRVERQQVEGQGHLSLRPSFVSQCVSCCPFTYASTGGSFCEECFHLQEAVNALLCLAEDLVDGVLVGGGRKGGGRGVDVVVNFLHAVCADFNAYFSHLDEDLQNSAANWREWFLRSHAVLRENPRGHHLATESYRYMMNEASAASLEGIILLTEFTPFCEPEKKRSPSSQSATPRLDAIRSSSSQLLDELADAIRAARASFPHATHHLAPLMPLVAHPRLTRTYFVQKGVDDDDDDDDFDGDKQQQQKQQRLLPLGKEDTLFLGLRRGKARASIVYQMATRAQNDFAVDSGLIGGGTRVGMSDQTMLAALCKGANGIRCPSATVLKERAAGIFNSAFIRSLPAWSTCVCNLNKNAQHHQHQEEGAILTSGSSEGDTKKAENKWGGAEEEEEECETTTDIGTLVATSRHVDVGECVVDDDDDDDDDNNSFGVLENFEYVTPLHVPVSQRVANAFRLFWDRPLLGIPTTSVVDTTSDVISRSRRIGYPLPTTATSPSTTNATTTTVAVTGVSAAASSSNSALTDRHAHHAPRHISYEDEEVEGLLLQKGTAEDPNEYTTWKPYYYTDTNDADAVGDNEEGGERNSTVAFPIYSMPRVAKWDPDLYGYSRLSAWRGKVEIDLKKWATNTTTNNKDKGATEKELCDDAKEGDRSDEHGNLPRCVSNHQSDHHHNRVFNFSAIGGSIDLCPFELPYSSQPHSLSPSVSLLCAGTTATLPPPPPPTAATASSVFLPTVPKPLPIAWITYGRYYERLVRPMRLFIRRVLLADLTNNLTVMVNKELKKKKKKREKDGILLPLRLGLDEGKKENESSSLFPTRCFPPLAAMPSSTGRGGTTAAGQPVVSEADAHAEGKRESKVGTETDTHTNKDKERNNNDTNNNNNNNNNNNVTNPSVFISTRDSGLWYAAELATLLESCMYAGCYPYWSTVGEEGIFGALKLCAPSVVVFDTFVMDRVLKGLLAMATAEVKNEQQEQNHHQHQQGEQGKKDAENERIAAVLNRMLKLMEVYYLSRVLVMATNAQEATLYECCSSPSHAARPSSRFTTAADQQQEEQEGGRRGVPYDESLVQEVVVNARENIDSPSSQCHLSDLSAHELLGLLHTYSEAWKEVNEEKTDEEEAERDGHCDCGVMHDRPHFEESEKEEEDEAKEALYHSDISGIKRLNGASCYCSKPKELWIEVLLVELFSSSSPSPFVNHFEKAHDVLERTLYDRHNTINKKHNFSDDDKKKKNKQKSSSSQSRDILLLPKYLDDSRIELVDLLLDFPRAKACNEAIRRERGREGQRRERFEIDNNNNNNNNNTSNETENKNCIGDIGVTLPSSRRKQLNNNTVARGCPMRKSEERSAKRPPYAVLEKRIGAIFTSGTSGGKPKGVVIDERTWFFDFFGSPSLSNMSKVNVNVKNGEGREEGASKKEEGEREGDSIDNYLSFIYPFERSDKHGASLSEHSPSWATDQYVVIGAFMNGSRVGFAPHSVPLLSPMLSANQHTSEKERERRAESTCVRTATTERHRLADAASPLSRELSPSDIPSSSSLNPLSPSSSPSSSSPRPTSSFFDALRTFRPGPTLTCVPVFGQQLRVEYLRLLEWYKQREEEEEMLLTLLHRGPNIAARRRNVCCTRSPPLLTPAQRAVASTRAAAKASAVFYRFYLGGRIESLGLGGASVPPLLQYFFRITTPIRVHNSYGSTEIGGILTSHRPVPGVTVRLVDRPELGYTTKDTPFPRGELAVRMPDNGSNNSSGPLQNGSGGRGGKGEGEKEGDSTVSKLEDWLGDAATMESVKKRYVRLPSSTNTATSAKKGANAEDKIFNDNNNSSLYMLTGDVVMQVGTNTYVVIDRVSSVQKLANGKFFSAEAIEEAIRRYFLSIVVAQKNSQQKQQQKSQKMRRLSGVGRKSADDDRQQSDRTNSPSPFPFFLESVLVAPSLDQENTVALLRFKIDSNNGGTNDWFSGEERGQEDEVKERGGEQQKHPLTPQRQVNRSQHSTLSEKNLLRHVVKACAVGAGIAPDEVPIHVYLDNRLDRLAASSPQNPKPSMSSGGGKEDLISSWGPWSSVNKCLTPSGKVNRAVIVRDRLNVLMELDKRDVDERDSEHHENGNSESFSSSSRSSSRSSSSSSLSSSSPCDRGHCEGAVHERSLLTPKRLFFDSLLGLRAVSLCEVDQGGCGAVREKEGSRKPTAPPCVSTLSIALAQWILNEVLPGAFCVLSRFTLIPTTVSSTETPLPPQPQQQPSFVLLHSPSSSSTPSFSYLTSYSFQAVGGNSLLLARAKSVLIRTIGEAIQSKLRGVLAKSDKLLSENTFLGKTAELSFPLRFFETFTVPFLLSATPMSVANLFLAKLEPFVVQCKVRERAAALMMSRKATASATTTTNTAADATNAPTESNGVTLGSQPDGLMNERRAEAHAKEKEEDATKSFDNESGDKTRKKEEGTVGVVSDELISEDEEAKRNDVESAKSEKNTEKNQEKEEDSETQPVDSYAVVTAATASAPSTVGLTTKKNPRKRSSSLSSSSAPRLSLFIQKSEKGSSDLLTIDKTLPPGFKEMPVLVDDEDMSGPCVGHLYLWSTIERNVREIIDEGLARANSRLELGRRSRHVFGGMRTSIDLKKNPKSLPLRLRSTNSRVVTVITGATGFLGVTLLRKVLLRLLQQDKDNENDDDRNEMMRNGGEKEEEAWAPPLVFCLMRMANPPRGEEQGEENEEQEHEESAQNKFIQREEQRLKSYLRKLLQDSLSFSPHLPTDKAAGIRKADEEEKKAADDHHRLSLLLSLFDRYVGVIPITDLGDVKFGYRDDLSLSSSSSRPSVPSCVEDVVKNDEAMLHVNAEGEAEKRRRERTSSDESIGTYTEASSPYERFVINRILESSYAHNRIEEQHAHAHVHPLPIVIINSGAAVKHWGISEETVRSIGPANIIGAVNCGQLAVDLAVADSLLMLHLQQRTAPRSTVTAVGNDTNTANEEKEEDTAGGTPSQCSATAVPLTDAGAGAAAAAVVASNMNRVALVHVSTSSCDVGQVSYGSLPKSWLIDLHKDHLEREENNSSNGSSERRTPFNASISNNSPLRNLGDAYTVTKLLGEMGLAYLAERVATARFFPNSSLSNNTILNKGEKSSIPNLLSALLVPQFKETDPSSSFSSLSSYSSSFSFGIVRAPMLTWDTETNFNNKNDWISQLLETCRLLRIVPLIPPLMKHCGSIAFSPVDHFALLVLRGADEQLLCRSDVVSRWSWRHTRSTAVTSSFEGKSVMESEPTAKKAATASSAPPIPQPKKVLPLPPTPSEFESVYSQHPMAMAIKASVTLGDMRDERVDRGFGFVGFDVFREVPVEDEDNKEAPGSANDCDHSSLRNASTDSDMDTSRGGQHRFPSIAHLLICFTSTQEQRGKLSRYLMDCRRQKREKEQEREEQEREAAAKENAAAGGGVGGEGEIKATATTAGSIAVGFGSANKSSDGADTFGTQVTPVFTHPTALYLPPLSSLDFFKFSFYPPPYFFMSKVLAVLVDEENKLRRNALAREEEEYEKENEKETEESKKENEMLALSARCSFEYSWANSNYFTIVPSHSFAFALGTMCAELEEEENEERTAGAAAAAAAEKRAVTSSHHGHTTVKRKGGDYGPPSSSSLILPPSPPLTLAPYHLHHPRHFKFPLAPPPSAGVLSSMFSSSTTSKSSRVTAAEMNRRRAAVKELAEAIVSTEGLFGLREGSTMAFPQANSDICERDGSVLPNAQAQCGGGHDASGGGYAARVSYTEGVGQLGESLVESTDRKLWEPSLRKWIAATYMN